MFIQACSSISLQPTFRNPGFSASISELKGKETAMSPDYSTIIPLFVSKLTTSTLALGLVAMLSQGGWHLPQLLSANLVERLSRRKPVIINLGFFLERLPLWLK